MNTIRRVLVAVAMTLILAIGACSRVTPAKYDKIQPGMTYGEVERVLGKPTETKAGAADLGTVGGSARMVTWRHDGKSITVTFVNDKVVSKVGEGL